VPDPKRVLWYLRKVPLLADLGPDAIARMAERVELREARRRDVVYLPGDPGRSLFFVHGGRIKVSKVTRDGKSLTLAYHGPAELFGDSCLLDGGPKAFFRCVRGDVSFRLGDPVHAAARQKNHAVLGYVIFDAFDPRFQVPLDDEKDLVFVEMDVRRRSDRLWNIAFPDATSVADLCTLSIHHDQLPLIPERALQGALGNERLQRFVSCDSPFLSQLD